MPPSPALAMMAYFLDHAMADTAIKISDKPQTIDVALIAGLGIALVCLVPGVDVAVSRLFFTTGAGFVWDHAGLMEFVRRAVPTMILGSLLFCVLLWIAGALTGEWIWNISTRAIVYLLTT